MERHDCIIDVDINCPDCFNATLATLRDHDGIHEVSGSIADGRIHVVHDGDAAPVLALVESIGRRWHDASNGETVLDRAHAHHHCES